MRSRFFSLTMGVFGVGLFSATLMSASCGARSSLEIPPPAPPLPKCVVDADCDGFADKCRHIRCVLDDGTGGSGSSATSSASTGGCTQCCDNTKGCPPPPGTTSSSSSSGSTSASTGDGSGGGSSGEALTVAASGRCVEAAKTTCDDDNPCTIDSCNSDTGGCDYQPATHDLDEDGHNGPLEGTKAGTPGSCGDDCDDTNANAYPGNKEVCDGVDNDCNGIVDDNATFIPLQAEPEQISVNPTAAPGSLAYNGTNYNATFTESTAGAQGHATMYTTMLDPDGNKIDPGPVHIEDTVRDSFGGAVVWTGDRFGVTWEAQDSSYHTYFSLLDDTGKKFLPTQQLDKNTQEFSINQDIGFTGQNFVVLWQDDRNGPFDIYGSVVGLDGTVIHPDVRVTTDDAFPNESPIVAASSQGIGVVWAHGDAITHFVRFQTFNFDLTPIGMPVDLAGGDIDGTSPVYPTVIFNHDRYVVAWFDTSAPVGAAAIYATVLDLQGNTLVPPKAVTNPGVHHSRYPFLRALGDRVLLVFSDDRDGNQGYELYSRVIDNNLNPVSAELRLTNAVGDSINPHASFGPNGDVGVLFRDDRTGDQHVWFTRLGCVAGTLPP